MSSVKRFSYVSAPNGKVAHVRYGSLVEGSPVNCGRLILDDWRVVKGLENMPVCKQCEAASDAGRGRY